MLWLRTVAPLAAALLLAGPARAQDGMVNAYLMDGGAFTNALMANSLAARSRAAVARAPSASTSTSPANKPGSLRFTPSQPGAAADELARTYPAQRRAEAAKTFRLLLARFHEVERLFGQPANDLPTALAFFIATSYEASTGTVLPPDRGRPLIAQLRRTMAADPAFAVAPTAEKQRLYEQLAIVGAMTSALTLGLQDRPDPALAARLKTAGDGYLSALDLDASRMRFTDQGLQLR